MIANFQGDLRFGGFMRGQIGHYIPAVFADIENLAEFFGGMKNGGPDMTIRFQPDDPLRWNGPKAVRGLDTFGGWKQRNIKHGSRVAILIAGRSRCKMMTQLYF